MTRQDYIDKLQDVLDRSFPDEQASFPVSVDDIAYVMDALAKASNVELKAVCNEQSAEGEK